MEFAWIGQLEKRKIADVLVLPFWKGILQAEWACVLPSALITQLNLPLEVGDFKGKEGEILCLYWLNQPEKRVVLLGLGEKEKVTVESLRRAYGSLTKSCMGRRFKTVNLVVPEVQALDPEALTRGVAEGLLLPNYAFDKYKHREGEESDSLVLLEKVVWIGPSGKELLPIAKKAQVVCEGVYYVRDLVNSNADEVTPRYLENCAREIANNCSSIKATIFSRKQIEKEKLGLLLAVNRGSVQDPAFIILEYRGNSKSDDHTVIIGKGVTYDTGGLNIKTTGMESMKCDMGGGAVCLGTILTASKLRLPVNVTAVIPATENATDAQSFKPGDVYTSYQGKTVEIVNTDAEGRLILADALFYATRNLNPTRLIDFATLTGAIEIALGPEATGMMSTEDTLAQALKQAGEETAERLWQMPLYEEYKDRLKSDIADLKNWNGRSASSCVAATFLKEFTGSIPWAHLDIASTAYFNEPRKYWPKYATGIGVRLMIEFLENLASL